MHYICIIYIYTYIHTYIYIYIKRRIPFLTNEWTEPNCRIPMNIPARESFMARSTHQGTRAAGTLTFDYVRYVQSCHWVFAAQGFGADPQLFIIINDQQL